MLLAPRVAVGIGAREAWFPALGRLRRDALDVLEVIVERVGASRAREREYQRLARRWPVVAHGVALGIGDARGCNAAHVKAAARVCERLGARWYGEHLCFLHGGPAGETPLEHFGPLDDDADTLVVLAANAAEVRAALPCPLLLENPADVLGFPAGGDSAGDAASPSEARAGAFGRALAACEAGAVLDVTNLLYNARNDGLDAREYIGALPLDRVVQVHVAGGQRVHGLWIDSHDRDVETETLALVTHVARRAPQLRAVTLEWDDDLPPLDDALTTVTRIRGALAEAGRR